MAHNLENDEKHVTITDLVAASDAAENSTNKQYFRSASSEDIVSEAVVNESASNVRNADSSKVFIKDHLRSMNMLIQGSKLGPQFADEYRRIKRPILSNAFGKSATLLERGNLILVTSAIPGEGKTHTAINLALSIAHERDHTVLLVDCDVTRHGTSQMLGISDRPGLVDILENDSFTVGDAILQTDVPELCLVSAGKQHDFVTELLASQKMFDFVSEIGQRYDDRVIIFDGPPLLPTPQTRILTSLVGQVVLVVEAGKTPQAQVEEALEMIPKEQATGLVMNKCEGFSGRNGYNYGYYGSKTEE